MLRTLLNSWVAPAPQIRTWRKARKWMSSATEKWDSIKNLLHPRYWRGWIQHVNYLVFSLAKCFLHSTLLPPKAALVSDVDCGTTHTAAQYLDIAAFHWGRRARRVEKWFPEALTGLGRNTDSLNCGTQNRSPSGLGSMCCHHTPATMAKINHTANAKCWQACGAIAIHVCCWRECPFWLDF